MAGSFPAAIARCSKSVMTPLISPLPSDSAGSAPGLPTPPERSLTAKRPRLVLSAETTPDPIFAFPPNRDTLGGTAYLIAATVKILVDCPAWDETTQAFLQAQGGVDWLVLTHRGGIGKVREIQQVFNCQVAIQEQEAYLLPGLTVIPFQRELQLSPATIALWTPGHSPGSACVYHQPGRVLFSGRHLLPDPQGQLKPLKTAKTFHWPRQLQSLQGLVERFNSESLQYVCPGANTGFLRGQYAIAQPYEQLANFRAQ